ncbi:MAG: hypothetical protein Q8P19_00750 [bacterium]|nr:hypothetical protein [bacterium]
MPLKVQLAAACTLHDPLWYEPEREPFVHERVCDAQVWPNGTLAFW